LSVVNGPLHAEGFCDGQKLLPQNVDVQRFVRGMENAADKEALAQVVVKNREFIDIAAMALKQANDGSHLARGARA
jgi:hypothetical protein